MSTSKKTAGGRVVASSSAPTNATTGAGYRLSRYGHSRHWAVHDPAGSLVCLAVYRRGAEELIRRLQAAGGCHE